VTKILGGDFLSHFPLIKDKESLSPHISFLPDTFDEVEYSPATPHMCDNHNTRWRLLNINHNFMIKSKNLSNTPHQEA
jgi:hypothetical protein